MKNRSESLSVTGNSPSYECLESLLGNSRHDDKLNIKCKLHDAFDHNELVLEAR